MAQARIAPIAAVLEHPGLQPAPLPVEWVRPGDQIFVVVAAGSFDGQQLGQGDLLVCRGHLHDGDTVVIASTGRGGHRLGTFTADGVVGAAGELCSGARWRVAGRVFAVVPSPRTLVSSPPRLVEPRRPAPRRPRAVPAAWRKLAEAPRPRPRAQLSLFAKAA